MDYFSPDEIIKTWKYPCAICGKKRHRYYLLDKIHFRMVTGENTNILIIGANRSGKSITSMIVGNDLTNGKFGIENVLWKWLDIIKAYQFRSKSALVLEEMGASDYGDRMNFYMDTNKYFKYLMETQAYLLNTLIMNVPDLDFIPKNLWSLLTFVIVCFKRGHQTLAKIYKVNPDRLKGKIRFNLISNWFPNMDSLPVELIDEYETRKDEYNKNNLAKWEELTTPKIKAQAIQQPIYTENEQRKKLREMGIRF